MPPTTTSAVAAWKGARGIRRSIDRSIDTRSIPEWLELLPPLTRFELSNRQTGWTLHRFLSFVQVHAKVKGFLQKGFFLLFNCFFLSSLQDPLCSKCIFVITKCEQVVVSITIRCCSIVHITKMFRKGSRIMYLVSKSIDYPYTSCMVYVTYIWSIRLEHN